MMPRNRNESDPDVNSPIMYDHYDSDEKMPGKERLRDIREPDGDEGQIRKPDIDEPYRSPKEDSNILPIDEPPHWDQETGDVDDARSTFEISSRLSQNLVACGCLNWLGDKYP